MDNPANEGPRPGKEIAAASDEQSNSIELGDGSPRRAAVDPRQNQTASSVDCETLERLVPECLRVCPQWVAWIYEYRGGKPTKVPIRPTRGGNASSTNQMTWGTFDQVMTACQHDADLAGVGFVFSASDSFAGIDLDNSIDTKSGLLKPWAQEIVDQLDSYTEVSPSGMGVKIFVRATKKRSRCKKRYGDGAVEMYDRDRFFTVTGNWLPNTSADVEERQAAFEAAYEEVFGAGGPTLPGSENMGAPTSNPNPHAPAGDEDVIRMLGHFNNGDLFKRLWRGEWHGDKYSSQNEADLALVNSLAFVCGADPERIDRLFRRSGLYRDKWDRHDYRSRTVRRALTGKTRFFRPFDAEEFIDSGSARPPCPEQQPRTETGPIEALPDLFQPAHRPSRDNERPRPSDPVELAKAGRPYARTDLGNAERFAARYGQDVRYVAAMGWFAWDGTRLRPDDTGAVMRFASRCAREIFRESSACSSAAARASDEAVKKKFAVAAEDLGKWARASESRNRLAAMIEIAKSRPGIGIRIAELDADPFALNCLNGTIDLRTGLLRPHDRSNLITKLAPVTFDPDSKCPLWLTFLDRVFARDATLVQFVQRYFGMGQTADVREQILPIFYGQGNNGKNVLLDTVCSISGDYASEAPPELLTVRKHREHPTEIADLCGRRLVIASETEEAATLRLQLVKRLTGNARLKGRFMCKDYFEFTRTHKLILVTNNRPVVRENTEAAWRRIRLVPFNVVIPPQERDPQLLQRLTAEWPGILVWLVQGCLDWLKHGLGEPPAVTSATSGYRNDQDVFSEFIAECCVLTVGARVSRATIYQTYSEWTQKTGEKRPLERAALFDRLRKIDDIVEAAVSEHGKRTRGFSGIGVQAIATDNHTGGV